MESRVKVFGHPIHPMLIVLPLGLFIMAVVCDILYLITRNPLLSTVAFYDIAGGLIGGLLAAIFGLIDYLGIPGGTRAKRIGLYHGLGNLILVVLFLVSWLMRLNVLDHIPSAGALILSFAGIVLGTLTAWFGGELVDRLGVGVDPGANVNAPNSLSGEPAGIRSSYAGNAAAQGPVTASQMQTGQIPITGENAPEEDEP